MIPRNLPPEPDSPPSCAREAARAARRHTLVEDMVKKAVLPRLLARKDDGAFDRGENVVRFPHGKEV
jgi:hypothetical protein